MHPDSAELTDAATDDTVDGIVTAYLHYGRHERNWSRRTTENVRYYLCALADNFAGRPIASLTTDELLHWMQHFAAGYRSGASWNTFRNTLRYFFKWCIENRKLAANPVAKIPRRKFRKRNKTTSYADFRKLRKAALQLSLSRRPNDVRNAAIWFFAAETACRSGEIESLTYSHVVDRLDNPRFTPGGMVYTVRITGKTGEGWVSFTEQTATALRRWIAIRPHADELPRSRHHDMLWLGFQSNNMHAPLRRDGGISVAFEQVARFAGVTENFRSHALRYLNCKYYVEQHGAKIAQAKLRHHRVEFTLEVYHQLTEEEVENATATASLLQSVNLLSDPRNGTD